MAKTEDKTGPVLRSWYKNVPIFEVEIGQYDGVIIRDDENVIDLVEHNGVWMTPEEQRWLSAAEDTKEKE